MNRKVDVMDFWWDAEMAVSMAWNWGTKMEDWRADC